MVRWRERGSKRLRFQLVRANGTGLVMKVRNVEFGIRKNYGPIALHNTDFHVIVIFSMYRQFFGFGQSTISGISVTSKNQRFYVVIQTG